MYTGDVGDLHTVNLKSRQKNLSSRRKKTTRRGRKRRRRRRTGGKRRKRRRRGSRRRGRVWLIGWGLTALSVQIGHIVPQGKLKFVKKSLSLIGS